MLDDEESILLLFEGPFITPSRSTPLIRSVWQQDPLGDARLVTAYPIRKAKL